MKRVLGLNAFSRNVWQFNHLAEVSLEPTASPVEATTAEHDKHDQ